jgi:hypothetical protein
MGFMSSVLRVSAHTHSFSRAVSVESVPTYPVNTHTHAENDPLPDNRRSREQIMVAFCGSCFAHSHARTVSPLWHPGAAQDGRASPLGPGSRRLLAVCSWLVFVGLPFAVSQAHSELLGRHECSEEFDSTSSERGGSQWAAIVDTGRLAKPCLVGAAALPAIYVLAAVLLFSVSVPVVRARSMGFRVALGLLIAIAGSAAVFACNWVAISLFGRSQFFAVWLSGTLPLLGNKAVSWALAQDDALALHDELLHGEGDGHDHCQPPSQRSEAEPLLGRGSSVQTSVRQRGRRSANTIQDDDGAV